MTAGTESSTMVAIQAAVECGVVRRGLAQVRDRREAERLLCGLLLTLWCF